MRIFSLFKSGTNWVHKRLDPISYARKSRGLIGEHCRLVRGKFGSEPWLIRIGDHFSRTCVTFVTHDGGVWVVRDQHPDIDRVAPIVIGNNVVIGLNSIIVPGVTIGSNVAVGANSVVAHDLPDNTVAVGSPARVVRELRTR